MLPSEMLSPATREVATVFLRLGVTAFGGPAAHIAAMDDELVERRGWVTRAEFTDLLSATNVVPGPNSTELAIHLGFRRAGWPGFAMAGLCFILPATMIVWTLARWYVRVGQRPEVAAMLLGMQPVVLAVVLAVVTHAIWRLRRSAVCCSAVGMCCWRLCARSLCNAMRGSATHSCPTRSQLAR